MYCYENLAAKSVENIPTIIERARQCDDCWLFQQWNALLIFKKRHVGLVSVTYTWLGEQYGMNNSLWVIKIKLHIFVHFIKPIHLLFRCSYWPFLPNFDMHIMKLDYSFVSASVSYVYVAAILIVFFWNKIKVFAIFSWFSCFITAFLCYFDLSFFRHTFFGTLGVPYGLNESESGRVHLFFSKAVRACQVVLETLRIFRKLGFEIFEFSQCSLNTLFFSWWRPLRGFEKHRFWGSTSS